MFKMYVLCALFVNGHVHVNIQCRETRSYGFFLFLCMPRRRTNDTQDTHTELHTPPPQFPQPLLTNFTFTFGNGRVQNFPAMLPRMWVYQRFCCVFLGYLYIYACKVDNKRFCRLSMGLNVCLEEMRETFRPFQYWLHKLLTNSPPQTTYSFPIKYTSSNRRRASRCNILSLRIERERGRDWYGIFLLYVSRNVHKMPKVTWKLIYFNIWALVFLCCYPSVQRSFSHMSYMYGGRGRRPCERCWTHQKYVLRILFAIYKHTKFLMRKQKVELPSRTFKCHEKVLKH